jgi:hypothetical protein
MQKEKEKVQKIESAKNIKKEEPSKGNPSNNLQNVQNQKQILEPKNSQNKMPPKVINSNHSKREDAPMPR